MTCPRIRMIVAVLGVWGSLATAPFAEAQWTATWTQKHTVLGFPNGPHSRAWMDMLFDPVIGRNVLIAGSGAQYMNDIWYYDSAADSWTNIEPFVPCYALPGFVPPVARDEAAVDFDSGNRLYWMHGGSGFGCKGPNRTAGAGTTTTQVVDPTLTATQVDFYKDYRVNSVSTGKRAFVSAYDPVTKTLTLSTPISDMAPGRLFNLYAQGGADTWWYDPVTHQWSSLNGPHWGQTGPTPVGGLSPAMAYSPVDRMMLVFGGLSADNSTWALDADAKQFVRLIPNGVGGSPPPIKQILNSMVYDPVHDEFILFGGQSGAYPTYDSSPDMWVFRPTTNSWTKRVPVGAAPSRRQQHAMVYDPDNQVVILFGGQDPPSAQYGFADLWVYDPAANTWTQVTGSGFPPGRRLHAMVYDSLNRVTVLYSGAGSLRDVWTLRLTRTGEVGNPVPLLTSLDPSSAEQGTTAPPLTVNGSGFIGTSVVLWNGSPRPTALSSATQLQATLADSDLSVGGGISVSVVNPAPGGGTSNSLTFLVTSPPPPPPEGEIILDNAAAGVQDPTGGRTFTGTWCVSSGTGGYGPDSLYSCGTAADTYRWTPTLAASQYAVYVWWSSHVNRSKTVPISVTHAAGTTTRTFNEQTGSGVWVLHGTYTFNAGTGGYVQVSAANGQAAADAVRFVPSP